jgi:ubiquitin carboxyl-terminal hydrolase 47
LAEAL